MSRGTIINSINKLIEKGLLEKVNKKYNGRGKDIRILTIPGIEKNSPMGTEFEPLRVQNLNPTRTKFEPKHTNKTNKKNNIKKHTKQNRPSQEEFKEFFKKQGYEMLADDFYKYCNKMGWENIRSWRALAKGYINNPYDLTESKKPNKPKTTQKKHKTNRKVTQEDKEELKALMNSLHEGPI